MSYAQHSYAQSIMFQRELTQFLFENNGVPDVDFYPLEVPEEQEY